MQLPGQGDGRVNTVTVVTPDKVRMGFILMARRRFSLGGIWLDCTN
jgi:hypothetical protein